MEQRLIDANAIITFVSAGHLRNPMEKTWSDNDVVDMIESRPTVDAVPVVHGHWEIVPNDENTDGYYKMRCSVCGEILWSIQSEELYCCKCGAKMDECADGERRSDD